MKPSDMNQEPATAAPAGWREFLARMEWSGEMYDRFGDHACICPDCGGQQAVGHGPGCELAAMLAAAPAPVAPIDMVLHCPACGLQHVDAPWQPGAALTNEQIVGAEPVWNNPPHRSHLCHGCGHRWRPADVPTNGVAAVKTKGKADSPPVAPAPVAHGDPLSDLAARQKPMPADMAAVLTENAWDLYATDPAPAPVAQVEDRCGCPSSGYCGAGKRCQDSASAPVAQVDELAACLRALLFLIRRDAPGLSGKALGLADAALQAYDAAPAPVALCACKDRPADQCPGEWEPGCDLGANEAHARAAPAPVAPTGQQERATRRDMRAEAAAERIAAMTPRERAALQLQGEGAPRPAPAPVARRAPTQAEHDAAIRQIQEAFEDDGEAAAQEGGAA